MTVPLRAAGGAARARVVDAVATKDAIETLSATNDATQRTGRPGARVIDDIALSVGSTTSVAHGCSSTRVKWVVCGINANAVVWQTSVDDKLLGLQASATCTISIEIWGT